MHARPGSREAVASDQLVQGSGFGLFPKPLDDVLGPGLSPGALDLQHGLLRLSCFAGRLFCLSERLATGNRSSP